MNLSPATYFTPGKLLKRRYKTSSGAICNMLIPGPTSSRCFSQKNQNIRSRPVDRQRGQRIGSLFGPTSIKRVKPVRQQGQYFVSPKYFKDRTHKYPGSTFCFRKCLSEGLLSINFILLL